MPIPARPSRTPRRVRRGPSLLAVFLVAGCGDGGDAAAPPAGSDPATLEIQVAVIAGDPDLDGYIVLAIRGVTVQQQARAAGSGETGLPDIQSIRPDGTGLVNLTKAPGAPDIQHDWSPDGSRILFRTIRDCCVSGELYVIDRTGGGLTQISRPEGQAGDFNAKWSPDGARVAFTSDRGGSWRVYLMNADETGIAQLVPDAPEHGQGCSTCGDFVQAWSPDGTRIVLKRVIPTAGGPSAANDPELYLFELSIGTLTKLTDNSHDDHAATWIR